MSITRKLRDQYLNGAIIVVSGGPVFQGRKDGRWPVLYIPRYTTDPRPWVAFGTEFRYSGGELSVLPKPDPYHIGWEDGLTLCGSVSDRTTADVGKAKCVDCLDAYDVATGVHSVKTGA